MGDGAAQWAVPLDALSGVAWGRSVQVDALLPLDTLVVRTRNCRYEGFLLEILHDGQTIVTTDVQSVSKTDHPSVH